MDKFKLIKLDKRFAGHRDFEYRVEVMNYNFQREDQILMYLDVRKWCWEQFGPSCELDLHRSILRQSMRDPETHVPQWAWRTTDDHQYFLFFAGSAMTHFNMFWM